MSAPLVADLHVRYTTHALAGAREASLRRMVRGPRVTLDFLARGGVRLALSVVYSPFDEMDLDRPYGAAPETA